MQLLVGELGTFDKLVYDLLFHLFGTCRDGRLLAQTGRTDCFHRIWVEVVEEVFEFQHEFRLVCIWKNLLDRQDDSPI